MESININQVLERYAASLGKVLYEEDLAFMEGMKERCLASNHDS